jgi:hypothetical protein
VVVALDARTVSMKTDRYCHPDAIVTTTATHIAH